MNKKLRKMITGIRLPFFIDSFDKLLWWMLAILSLIVIWGMV